MHFNASLIGDGDLLCVLTSVLHVVVSGTPLEGAGVTVSKGPQQHCPAPAGSHPKHGGPAWKVRGEAGPCLSDMSQVMLMPLVWGLRATAPG